VAHRTRHRHHLTLVSSPEAAHADAGCDEVDTGSADPLATRLDRRAPTADVAFTDLRGTVAYQIVTRGATYNFDPVPVVDRSSLAAPATRGEQAQATNVQSQPRIASQLRRLSSAADRPGRSVLGPDQVELWRIWGLRPATGVARIEDGVSWGGLGDERVHADPLDARLRHGSLRIVRCGARALLRLRLVLR
jgi:hypothetical protein